MHFKKIQELITIQEIIITLPISVIKTLKKHIFLKILIFRLFVIEWDNVDLGVRLTLLLNKACFKFRNILKFRIQFLQS